MTTPFSVLDLAFVPAGSEPADALRNTLDLARHAERWGFRRFWLAEHHNMIGIASAATAVVIGYVAAGTRTIRVGAGGIMLPNHAPLVIAEQFGTLESLYPNRIDLGLGRAPGTDPRTSRALRVSPISSDTFPQDVLELQSYFAPLREGRLIQAVPGTGLNVPLWILGSSLFGAQLAAELGLPYAFASHFMPGALLEALAIYRARFKPSSQLDRPWAMAGVNVFAADTDAEGRRLFTSAQQSFANIFRGTRGRLAATDRRHRDVLDARGETAGVGDAGLLVRRFPRYRSPRPGRVHREDGCRRGHRCVGDLRSRSTSPLVRDGGGDRKRFVAGRKT
jgi:luciferase family oxidoreductase group 1